MVKQVEINKFFIAKPRSNQKKYLKKRISLKVEIHSYCSIKSSALSICVNRNFIKNNDNNKNIGK